MKRILVLLGGTSSEHDISLRTGRFIAITLSKKYQVKVLPITKNGEWIHPFPVAKLESHLTKTSHTLSSEDLDFFLKEEGSATAAEMAAILKKEADIVFLGLHGSPGEDGTIQGFLETIQIRYTGSGVLASALAMDKERSVKIFKTAGFHVPPTWDIHKSEFAMQGHKLLEFLHLPFPIFTKPTTGGSSVGVKKSENLEELFQNLEIAFRTEDRIQMQEYIAGMEVSCGILEKIENGSVGYILLPATEIIPDNEFFDFESKYKKGKSNEITPARISHELMKEVQTFSLKAHTVLGCRGYSRTDFIIRNGVPYILETNTLPGMTETSLIPQQAKAAGIEIATVFDQLIQIGLSDKG